MAVRAVVLLAVLATIVGAVVVLAGDSDRLLGSNEVPSRLFVADVPPGRELCQEAEVVPAGTRGVQLEIGTFDRPGPPLRVRMLDGAGATIAAGSLRAGYHQGWVEIPASRVARETAATVCVRNAGSRRQPIAIVGSGAPPDQAARVGRQPSRGVVTLEYLAGPPASRISQAGTVIHRVDTGRGGLLDGRAFWVVVACVLALWGIVLWILLRGRTS